MTDPAATILIVDDEIHNRKLLEMQLKPEGYVTTCVANGEAALASVAAHAPDLILLDVMMPGMDGYLVASRLKADPATSSIPIVMVTALVDRKARLAGLDAGVEEFLTKPAERSELILRVRNLLRLKVLSDFFKNQSSILERQVQARTAELQRANESLRESEARFRSLTEMSSDFYWESDTGHRLTARESVIAKPSTISEFEHGIQFGKDRLEIPYLSPDEAGWQAQRAVLDAHRPFRGFEFSQLTSDARERHLSISGDPVFDEAGAFRGYRGVGTDISDRKAAEANILRYVEELKTAFMSTVEVATIMSGMRDPYTAGHARRVAEIAVAIGAEFGLDESRQEGLRVAGHLHDIGKITVPSEILTKPGTRSSIEYRLVQEHAQAGYDVLKNVKFPWPVAQMALQHHERMDGTGYPQGLKGEAIMLDARIVAVADVVEAMASQRPYRAALGIEKALSEIERGRGTSYDPDIADACLKLFRERAYELPV